MEVKNDVDHILLFYKDVITYSCPDLSAGLTDLS